MLTVYLDNTEKAEVATLAEASQAVRRFLTERDLGASQWAKKGGTVLDEAGRKVARIAFNGRVIEA